MLRTVQRLAGPAPPNLRAESSWPCLLTKSECKILPGFPDLTQMPLNATYLQMKSCHFQVRVKICKVLLYPPQPASLPPHPHRPSVRCVRVYVFNVCACVYYECACTRVSEAVKLHWFSVLMYVCVKCMCMYACVEAVKLHGSFVWAYVRVWNVCACMRV